MADDDSFAAPMHEDATSHDSNMVYAFDDFIALMDALQVLGVDALQANRYVASLVKSKLQQPTVMEAHGRGKIVSMANSEFRNLNVLGKQALDLRTKKPSGAHWDFSRAQDRREAKDLVLRDEPTWLIGSPPCTPFSTLMALNYKHWTDEKVKEVLDAGRKHLRFVIALYRVQLAGNRHFLHEHPQSASSWRDPWMEDLLKHPRVGTTIGHQCRYGLTSPSPDGTSLPAMKPTRFASSSAQMLARLSLKCDKTHRHQQLMGGHAAEAAF